MHHHLVYATSAYASRVTLASDGIFSDGSVLELATVTGSVSDVMTATLTVAV